MSDKAKEHQERTEALSDKFFIIVDGDEGICLVGVSPPTVRYLVIADLYFIRQHFNMEAANLSKEQIALRLAGRGEIEEVLKWMQSVRKFNIDMGYGSGGMHVVNACISGEAPIELIVGRGRR